MQGIHTQRSTHHTTGMSHAQRTRTIQRVLVGVLLLNVAVAVAKLGYGYHSNSLSMTADGLNSLLDGTSNVVGLIGLAIAARPADPNHPYGHRRFETLTSLAIALFMILALFEIVQGSIHRLQNNEKPEVTLISFVVMVGTLLVNLIVTAWERRAGRRLNSSILIADARHTASDVFVTLSVIAGLIATGIGFSWADIALAFVVAGVIAWGAWLIVREAALSLSDVAAASKELIERAARTVSEVRGVHNIRTRGGDGMIWVDLHIQVDPEMHVDQAHEIASEVAVLIEREIGETSDVTVHIEPADPLHLRPERGYHPEDEG
ncbi:MAG TPA: cation diffusion facilitator family transporter [Nitrolancea sp.]|nr:cation diffusion facilitator family transporter [Nitrolancea sp.]